MVWIRWVEVEIVTNRYILTEVLTIFRDRGLHMWCARRWAKDDPKALPPPFGRIRLSFIKIRKARENASLV